MVLMTTMLWSTLAETKVLPWPLMLSLAKLDVPSVEVAICG
jgi:hypothetical protein